MDYANDLKRRIGMDTAHRVANNRKRAVRSFFDPNKKMAQAAFLKTLSGMRNYTYMFMRDAPKGKEWTGIKQFSTDLAKKKNASPRNANHSFRLTTSGTSTGGPVHYLGLATGNSFSVPATDKLGHVTRYATSFVGEYSNPFEFPNNRKVLFKTGHWASQDPLHPRKVAAAPRKTRNVRKAAPSKRRAAKTVSARGEFARSAKRDKLGHFLPSKSSKKAPAKRAKAKAPAKRAAASKRSTVRNSRYRSKA